MGQDLDQLLQQGLQQQQITASEQQRKALLEYLALLLKWNRTHNLTAIRDPAEAISKHLLDSLSILPALPPGALLDVGTGAGLPGIPIALLDPARQLVLLDSNSKKTAFLKEVKRQLALTNIEVVCARVPHFSEGSFNVITARAFAAIPQLLDATRHLLADDGCWLLMKGRYPDEELAALEDGYRVDTRSVVVAGLEGQRHLVRISL